MVELQANVVGISVLGYNYSFTGSFRSPPQQKRENLKHTGEYRKEKRNKVI
jgi:hypothetical protein